MKCRFAIALLLIILSLRASALDSKNAMLLDSLNLTLNRLEAVLADREEMLSDLKSLRQSLTDGEERVIIGEKIGRSYLSNNLDSALLYLRIAHKDAISSHLEEDELRLRLQLISLMPTTGVSKEALESFCAINYDDIPPSLRRNYWLSSLELYNSLQLPYPKGHYKNYYIAKRDMSLDSLLQYYSSTSPVGRYLEAHRHYYEGETNLAVASFAEILKDLTGHTELFDVAMGRICEYYADKPTQRQTYISMLLRRVIFNLNHGIIRPDALAQLGEILIEEHHGKLGRKCIRIALETSDYSYAMPFTRFDRSHYAHYVSDEATSLRRASWIWILLLMITCAAGIITTEWQRRRLKKTREVERLLREELAAQRASSQHTNQNLISLAFMAMEQGKDLNVHILRKLKAGQVKDLYADVESGKYIQRQREKYFTSFDSTFLSTFPDFVTKLNALFLPGRQIQDPGAETLTPELRIAAFMKLGITDTNKLSEALGLSINTIYTYRNRLKSRLIDKDNFEANLSLII